MDGKTGRERPRLGYISQIMKDMNMGSYRGLKESSFDRETWRAVADQSSDR